MDERDMMIDKEDAQGCAYNKGELRYRTYQDDWY